MLERTRSQFRVVCESTKPNINMFKFTKGDPDSETQAKERAEAYLAELNTKWDRRHRGKVAAVTLPACDLSRPAVGVFCCRQELGPAVLNK